MSDDGHELFLKFWVASSGVQRRNNLFQVAQFHISDLSIESSNLIRVTPPTFPLTKHCFEVLGPFIVQDCFPQALAGANTEFRLLHITDDLHS